MPTSNIRGHRSLVSRSDRAKQNSHRSVIVWFTGMSGAGKSTLAHAVERHLHELGCRTFVLDGDNVRHAMCSDLGFTKAERSENIRRIGEISKLFIEAGTIALTAFISPYQKDRNKVRALVEAGDFLEIYCHCSLEICEQRDVKGLYAKARSGEIKEFTGVSSPYEPPTAPELVLNTGWQSLDECVAKVIALLQQRGIINS